MFFAILLRQIEGGFSPSLNCDSNPDPSGQGVCGCDELGSSVPQSKMN